MEVIPEIGEDPAENVADDKSYHQKHNGSTPAKWQDAPGALHHMQRHHPIRQWFGDTDPHKDQPHQMN